jgi:hypothetical protein
MVAKTTLYILFSLLRRPLPRWDREGPPKSLRFYDDCEE